MSIRPHKRRLAVVAALSLSMAGIALAQQPYFRFNLPGNVPSNGGGTVTPPGGGGHNEPAKMTFGDGSIAPFSLRALVGEPVSLEFGTIGGTNPITWLPGPVMPAGLTYADGVIWGTPTAAASRSESVTAQDSTGATAQGRVTFEIVDPVVSLTQFRQVVRVGSGYVGTISGNVADPAYVVRNAPGASSVARTGNLADLSGIATTPGQFPLTVDVTRAGTQIFGTTSRQVTVANPLAIVFNPATVPAISGPVTVTATAQNVVGSGGLVRQDDPAALAARGLTYANGVLSGTLGIGPAASLSLRLTDSADNTEVTASLSIPEIVAQPATIVIGDLRPGEAPMAANGSATPAVIQTQIQNPVCTVTQAVPGIEVSSSCVISGAPTAPGNYTLGVSIVPASNPQAAPVVVSAPVVVNPTLVASSPQPNASPVPGGAVNLVVNTSGVVGTPSFELVGVTPAQLEEVGLSFDPATGAIVGTVDPDVALSPQVRLTDSKDGKSTLVTFTVVTGPATVSTNMGTANLRGGDVRQYTASTNIANPVFSLVGAPDYVVIDPQTGGITLTAPAVTELTTIPGFAIRASNATRPGVFKQVPVNNPGTVRPELVLTISQNASARGNVAFELPYTTAGASNPQALFVDSGTLPTGVTIQAGRLAGTPTVAGSFSFALRFVDASDGRGVTRNVEIVVGPLLDFTLAGPVSPLGKGTVGTAFSVAASAQNALGTVTFENVSTTARPVLLSAAGLTITTAGVISGTPTAPTSGTANIRMTEVHEGTTTVIEKPLVLAIAAPQNASGMYPVATYNGSDYAAHMYDASTTTSFVLPSNGVLRIQYDQPVTVNGVTIDGTSGRVYSIKNLTTNQTFSASTVGNNALTQTTSDAWEVTVNSNASISTFRLTFGGSAVLAPSFTRSGYGDPSYPHLTGRAMAAITPSAIANATAPVTWSVIGTLPPGASIDPATGSITGTLTQVGSYNFSVVATDGRGISSVPAAYNTIVRTGVTPYGKYPQVSGVTGDPADALARLYDGDTATVVGFTAGQTITYTFDEPVTAGQMYVMGGGGSYQITAVDEGVTFTEDSYYGYNSFRRQDGNTNLANVATSQTWLIRRLDGGSAQGLQLAFSGFQVPYSPRAAYAATTNGKVGTNLNLLPTTSAIGTTGGVTETGTFQVVGGTLPAWATLNPTTGAITGQPTSPGKVTIPVALFNSKGVRSLVSQVVVDVFPVNNADTIMPTLSGHSDPYLLAKLYDNDSTSTVSLPAGTVITYTFPEAVGVNRLLNEGAYSTSMTVRNVGTGEQLFNSSGVNPNVNASYGTQFSITLNAAANPSKLALGWNGVHALMPTLNYNGGDGSGMVNVAMTTMSGSITGATAPFTVTVTGTRPTGVDVNTTTASVSGTPTQSGSFPITVQVVDARGYASAPKTVNLSILPQTGMNQVAVASAAGGRTSQEASAILMDNVESTNLTLANNESVTFTYASPVSISGFYFYQNAGVNRSFEIRDGSGTLIQTAPVTYGFAHFPSGVSMGGYSYRSGTTFSIKNVSGTTVNLSRLVPSVGANPAVVYPWIGTPTSVTVPRTGNQSISFGAGGATGTQTWTISGSLPSKFNFNPATGEILRIGNSELTVPESATFTLSVTDERGVSALSQVRTINVQ